MSDDENVPLAKRREPTPASYTAPAQEARKRLPKERRKNDKKAQSRVGVNPDDIWAAKERKRRPKNQLATLRAFYHKQIRPWLGLGTFVVLASIFLYLRVREEFYDHEKALAMMHDSDDPFKVLDVGRNASTDDIKKAYYKLSLKWHPDKNPNCVDCTTKFAQIGVAYKKLSDPEKRQSVLKGMQDRESHDAESPIPSETFSLTDANFDSETAKQDAWLIQVYTDWSTASWDAVSEWEKTSEDIGKYVPMGRINFAKEEELGRRFQIFDVPTFLSYVGGKHTVFKGRPNPQNFTNFMLNSLRDSVWRITDANARIFLNENEDKVRVLLFANKDLSKLRLVYRMLARTYKQHMVLGEVSQLDSPGLFKLYNATADKPSLLFVKEKGVKPLRYSGQMTNTKLRALFEEHKYQVVPRLTTANADDLCARADNVSCVVFFTDAVTDAAKRDTIMGAMRNASRAAADLAMSEEEPEPSPTFVWSDLAKQSQLGAALGVSVGGESVLVAMQKGAGLAMAYKGDPTNGTAILEWAASLRHHETNEFTPITANVAINYEAPPINLRQVWRTVSPYITAILVCVVIALLWFAGSTYYKDVRTQKANEAKIAKINRSKTASSVDVKADKWKKLEDANRRTEEQRQRQRAEQERIDRERAERARAEEEEAMRNARKAAATKPKSPALNAAASEFTPTQAAAAAAAAKKAEAAKAAKAAAAAAKKAAGPKLPADSEIKARIQQIVRESDLETTTRRQVRNKLSAAYAGIDLSSRHDWIGIQIDAACQA